MVDTNFIRGDYRYSEDYLSFHSIYYERLFGRRFGVPMVPFWKFHDDMVDKNPDYWGTRKTFSGRMGVHSQKRGTMVSSCIALWYFLRSTGLLVAHGRLKSTPVLLPALCGCLDNLRK